MYDKHQIKTAHRTQIKDVTALAQKSVDESGIRDGLCVIFVPHTTAALTINENADPDVTRDMLMEINKIVPLNDGYLHMEGNSAAHIKTSLFGPSLTIIVDNGRLQLGTWQGVYFCEFDGPRNRQLWIKTIAG